MLIVFQCWLHLSGDGWRAWRGESSPSDRQEPLSHFCIDHVMNEKTVTYSEHTRVKVSQIEDDVLGVNDVEGGQQVRRVDVEQAVHHV